MELIGLLACTPYLGMNEVIPRRRRKPGHRYDEREELDDVSGLGIFHARKNRKTRNDEERKQ